MRNLRKMAMGLLAAAMPAYGLAATPAAAQGVYVDTGPMAFGFGVGPVYDRYYEPYAPVAYDYYYGPGYNYYAPARAYDDDDGPRYIYRRARVYSYTPPRYRVRYYTDTRVYHYTAPRAVRSARIYGYTSMVPAPTPETRTTVITTVRPGSCGAFHFWRDGRCIDARGEISE